jgi:hypothetical protein
MRRRIHTGVCGRDVRGYTSYEEEDTCQTIKRGLLETKETYI